MDHSGSSSSLDSLDLDAHKYHQRRRRKAYRKIVIDIADYLDKGDVEKIVWRYGLSKKSKEESPMEVLDSLHRKGELSEIKVSELREMLEELNHHQLVYKHVEPFQQEFQDSSKSEVKPIPCVGSTVPFGDAQSEIGVAVYRSTQSSFEDESNTSTHSNSAEEINFSQRQRSQPLTYSEVTSQPTSLSTSQTSSSLDRLSETNETESPVHGTSYHLGNPRYPSQKVCHTTSLPPTPTKGSYESEVSCHNTCCQHCCPDHQRRTLHEQTNLGVAKSIYEDDPNTAPKATVEVHKRRRPQSSEYGRAVKRRDAFRTCNTTQHSCHGRPQSWTMGCTCRSSCPRQYPQPTTSDERNGHTHFHTLATYDEPQEDSKLNSDFEGRTETKFKTPKRNRQENGAHGLQIREKLSRSLENLVEQPQCPKKSSTRSQSLDSLDQLSESIEGSTITTTAVPVLAVQSSSVVETTPCLSAKQTVKKSVLSILKYSFTRTKLILPGKELVWTEKIEHVWKYIFLKKFQERAITCPAKLEVDGKGFPNPKLSLRLYPYGIEDDQNKQVTLEVEIELQKKARLPSSTKLALTVNIESNQRTHHSHAVQEDARLTFFYIKGIISHSLLKSLQVDSEHITLRVQAEIIFPA